MGLWENKSNSAEVRILLWSLGFLGRFPKGGGGISIGIDFLLWERKLSPLSEILSVLPPSLLDHDSWRAVSGGERRDRTEVSIIFICYSCNTIILIKYVNSGGWLY